MSEASGVAAGRHRSRVEAARLAAEYEQSGMVRKAFCAQHGLSVATLDNYRKRHRTSIPKSEGRILPVEIMAGTETKRRSLAPGRRGLWGELDNGRRVEVNDGV